MTLASVLVSALLIVGLGLLFALSIYLNSKTPLPEQYQLPSMKCQHCNSSTCSYSEVSRNKSIKEGGV